MSFECSVRADTNRGVGFECSVRADMNRGGGETALQKLDYIHNNPLSERWQLCANPVDYYYSSAKFYETGIDDFGFLKHIMDEF